MTDKPPKGFRRIDFANLSNLTSIPLTKSEAAFQANVLRSWKRGLIPLGPVLPDRMKNNGDLFILEGADGIDELCTWWKWGWDTTKVILGRRGE